MFQIILSVALGGSFLIKNVTVEVGNGTALEKVNVLVEDQKIRAVGSSIKNFQGTTFDGQGKVLAPGFIGAWTQIGLTEVELEKSTVDQSFSGDGIAPAFHAADGFQPKSVRIQVSRSSGVLSAVVAPVGGLIAGSGAWVDFTGLLQDKPSAALALFGSIGTSDRWVGGESRGGLWMRLRQLFEDVRFYQRNRAAIDRGEHRALIVSPLQLQAMVPVLEKRIPLVLRAHRASDILSAVEFASKQNIRLVIDGGEEAWMVAGNLSKAQIPVMLTPSIQTPRSFETLQARDDSAALLHKAGVPVIIHTDMYEYDLRRLRQEAGVAVAYGLSHAAALQAITKTPATVFGRKDVGTIEVGQQANLVLWTGDPLELSSLPEKVWIRGEEYSTTTRQRLLAERYSQVEKH